MSPRKRTSPDAPPATLPAAPIAPRRRGASRSAVTTPREASEAPDMSKAPLEQFVLGLPPRTLVAPNFRLYELTRSDLALRLNIDNRFETVQQLRSAVHLAREVLQPVREAFDKPFSPNSVFRGQALERALKKKPSTWVSTSQHAKGEACDIEIVATPTLDLASWAEKNLDEYDQIICECYDPAQGPNSGWVHISLKAPGTGKNRKQLLSYVRDPASGRLVYVTGLTAMV